jgi:CubicO group peptidase (beta-lactamase class C family)
LGLLIITVFFILEVLLLAPESFETYAMNLHGFVLGLMAFFFGFSFVITGNVFWNTVSRWQWMYLVTAIALFVVRLIVFQIKAPGYLVAIESNAWIFAILGLGYRYLNRPGKTLSYLTQAAYPVYILHMIFLYLGSYLIFPLELSPWLRFILVVIFTFAGCFLMYEFIIRRTFFLRPLFGLKTIQGKTVGKKEPESMKKLKTISIINALLFIFFLTLINVSCQSRTSGQYTLHQPENTGDGLQVDTLEEASLKSNRLEKAVNEIKRERYKEVHAMLILKDNKLVLEEYFEGHDYQWDAPRHHGPAVSWDMYRLHQIHSVTKSITSTCIGIAVYNGLIKNVHQSIFDYLPGYESFATGGKEKITIEHLLTMTSGLEWKEWSTPYSSIENPCIDIYFNCDDQIACILERPLITQPGSSFNYSGGNMILLGEILKNATGMDIDEFSRTYLFEPLGIDSSAWTVRYPSGIIESAGTLAITPRAMLKIGLLFLNNGRWNGNTIISEQWVEKSAEIYGNDRDINIPEEPSGRNGYGYSWWIKDYNMRGRKIHMFSAGGWGGQHIMVLPEINMVVVFTGANYTTRRPPFKILEKYILPAVEF